MLRIGEMGHDAQNNLPKIAHLKKEGYVFWKGDVMAEMKNAYELAMERFGEDTPVLSQQQKEAIGAIQSKLDAQLAELDFTFNQQIENEADPAKASIMQQTKLAQMAEETDRAEAEKELIRNHG